MEDSSEGVSEDNKLSPEKNVKRTLKTLAQIATLEEFYSEHKYPSEELKGEIGERIGLTEKQISSWFCHRRLKDKKKIVGSSGGKQERSGSIIQDRGSGLRQDSCGSTKQDGDFRTGDLKEVESERFYRNEYQSTDLNLEDSSPQSSESLQEKSVSSCEDRIFAKKNCDLTQPSLKISNGVPFKPAGYLKVRGDIENAAITAVKRQLGRHYREDGPVLGVEFELVPPGAFISQRRHLASGSFYAGDLMRTRSAEFRGDGKASFGYTNKIKNQEFYASTVDQFEPDFLQSSRKSRLEVDENNAHEKMNFHGKRRKNLHHESKGKFGSSSVPSHDQLNDQKGEQMDDITAENSLTTKRSKSMTKPLNKSFSKLSKNKKSLKQQKEATENCEIFKKKQQHRMESPPQETAKIDSSKKQAFKGSAAKVSSSFRNIQTAETSSSGE